MQQEAADGALRYKMIKKLLSEEVTNTSLCLIELSVDFPTLLVYQNMSELK